MKATERMTGAPVDVDVHALLEVLFEYTERGELERLRSDVATLKDIVSWLVEANPEALKKLIAEQWRYEILEEPSPDMFD